MISTRFVVEAGLLHSLSNEPFQIGVYPEPGIQSSEKAIKVNVNQAVNYGTTRRPCAGCNLQAVCISNCTTDEAM